MPRTIIDLICIFFFISFKDESTQWRYILKEGKPQVRNQLERNLLGKIDKKKDMH